MIGNNKLHLNQASLIGIVQGWIDRDTTLRIKVTSINMESDGDYFVVTTTDDDRQTIPDCNNP